ARASISRTRNSALAATFAARMGRAVYQAAYPRPEAREPDSIDSPGDACDQHEERFECWGRGDARKQKKDQSCDGEQPAENQGPVNSLACEESRRNHHDLYRPEQKQRSRARRQSHVGERERNGVSE